MEKNPYRLQQVLRIQSFYSLRYNITRAIGNVKQNGGKGYKSDKKVIAANLSDHEGQSWVHDGGPVNTILTGVLFSETKLSSPIIKFLWDAVAYGSKSKEYLESLTNKNINIRCGINISDTALFNKTLKNRPFLRPVFF